MRRDVTYAVVVPIVVVCVAVILMIWAMSGPSGGRIEGQGPTAATTGTASTRMNENAVRALPAASHDAADDGARATKGSQTKNR
jgi:hypothetical protein